MAIIYPLNTPTSIGIEGIELRAVNAVAISQSPFTYKQQVIAYQGQRWEASVNIPSVRRDLAEDWNAFLLSLRGPTGTFLLGDPNAVTPRGAYSNYTTSEVGGLLLEDGSAMLLESGDAMLWERGTVGSLRVDGAGQIGSELNIKDCIANVTGFLKAGDYIQLGSAASSTLHKVLVDVDTDSIGHATLDIWPSINIAPSDNAVVTVTNCKGVFRLSSNVSSWSINNASVYGIQFEAVQAL